MCYTNNASKRKITIWILEQERSRDGEWKNHHQHVVVTQIGIINIPEEVKSVCKLYCTYLTNISVSKNTHFTVQQNHYLMIPMTKFTSFNCNQTHILEFLRLIFQVLGEAIFLAQRWLVWTTSCWMVCILDSKESRCRQILFIQTVSSQPYAIHFKTSLEELCSPQLDSNPWLLV